MYVLEQGFPTMFGSWTPEAQTGKVKLWSELLQSSKCAEFTFILIPTDLKWSFPTVLQAPVIYSEL